MRKSRARETKTMIKKMLIAAIARLMTKQKQPEHVAKSRKAAADAKRRRKAQKRRDDDVWSRKNNPYETKK